MPMTKRLVMTAWLGKVSNKRWFLAYIIATASPRNRGTLKSLCAHLVFDYRDPDSLAKVKVVT
ncbi:hypothetical protein BDM02DRAFT_3119569 [Thelephora ganbajun]|uniref:Uncharacterized protein n=1 Tax=Thelephora ganbajun TaxID=370292 RepID=A0ACB6Z8B7_THEGA|nr:hypothetical protein BDM02DRAFT_3119569 [Thelephora ganbajun]